MIADMVIFTAFPALTLAALSLATTSCYQPSALLLLQDGADAFAKNRSSLTPLLLAVSQGHLLCAQLLQRHVAAATACKPIDSRQLVDLTSPAPVGTRSLDTSLASSSQDDGKMIDCISDQRAESECQVSTNAGETAHSPNSNGVKGSHQSRSLEPSKASTVEAVATRMRLFFEAQDSRGSTALHYASRSGHAECLSWLLRQPELEAILNKRNDAGRTPLREAHLSGSAQCISLLDDRLLTLQRDADAAASSLLIHDTPTISKPSNAASNRRKGKGSVSAKAQPSPKAMPLSASEHASQDDTPDLPVSPESEPSDLPDPLKSIAVAAALRATAAGGSNQVDGANDSSDSTTSDWTVVSRKGKAEPAKLGSATSFGEQTPLSQGSLRAKARQKPPKTSGTRIAAADSSSPSTRSSTGAGNHSEMSTKAVENAEKCSSQREQPASVWGASRARAADRHAASQSSAVVIKSHPGGKVTPCDASTNNSDPASLGPGSDCSNKLSSGSRDNSSNSGDEAASPRSPSPTLGPPPSSDWLQEAQRAMAQECPIAVDLEVQPWHVLGVGLETLSMSQLDAVEVSVSVRPR